MTNDQPKSWLQPKWWFAAIVTGIIAGQIQDFLSSWQFFLIIITFLIVLVSILLVRLLSEKGGLPDLPLGETKELPEFVKIIGVISVLILLFLLFNLIIFISGTTALELLGIGSTHTDRLGMILDVMGIIYSVVGLITVVYLGYLLLKIVSDS